MNVIVVDLDDTLLDDTCATREALSHTLASQGLPADPDSVDNALSHIRKMWSKHPHRHTGPLTCVSAWEALWLTTENAGLPATVTDSLAAHDRQVWARIIESLHGDPGTAPVAARTFRARRRGVLRLLPGVPAALKRLRTTHAVWVATNGLPAHQQMKVQATGLDRLIERVVISGDVGTSKSNPGFAAAVRASLTAPGQRVCLVVGDSAEQDLRLARHGGWRACHICPATGCSARDTHDADADADADADVTHVRSLAQVDAPCGC